MYLSGVETLWKCTASAEFQAICSKHCEICVSLKKLYTRTLDEITVFYVVFRPTILSAILEFRVSVTRNKLYFSFVIVQKYIENDENTLFHIH